MIKQILWIASTNLNKIAEYQAILSDYYEIKSIQNLDFNYVEPEENGKTFRENAKIKSQHLGKYVQGLVVADDSGICVEVLNDFPNVLSKRWAWPLINDHDINKLLLEKVDMKNHNKRNAKFVTCLALFDTNYCLTEFFEGVVQGELAKNVIEGQGFGYDAIFIPNGYSSTYSQLGQEIKNKISSRSIAINLLTKYLKKDVDYYNDK